MCQKFTIWRLELYRRISIEFYIHVEFKFLNINLDLYIFYLTRTYRTQTFLPHQNLASSHHLSSGVKDSKPLKYINSGIN